MLFNSIEYSLFLPLVFLIYWKLQGNRLTWQNLFIVGVSYLFYGWWNWRFLLLISFTSICSFLSGLGIHRAEERNHHVKARLYVAANVVVNLLVLGLYKYYDFFISSMADLLNSLGLPCSFSTLGLILPVGISFYTFQALSYTVDVYKRKIEATADVVAFFAFVSFFPQLVAGPIERATNLLPQFQRRRSFSYQECVDGLQQILWGLFKKLVVADNCSVLADEIFAGYGHYGPGTLWLGALFFTFQIYGDFSGYSDIAIGSARLFGIQLKRNFIVPYLSLSIAEFWKRWHISLNTWFVDYLYIPLGGSRCGKLKTVRNTFVIFLVSGIWHGANWTFIVWGLYHALLFIPHIFSNKRFKKSDEEPARLWLQPSTWFHMLVTMVLVMLGWVFFRANSIKHACDYLLHMFVTHDSVWLVPRNSEKVIVYILILWVVEWLMRRYDYALQLQCVTHRKWLRILVYTILILFIEFSMGRSSEFIYFQF